MDLDNIEDFEAVVRAARRWRTALETIQHWDMLNSPQQIADLPWLRKLVDEALEES